MTYLRKHIEITFNSKDDIYIPRRRLFLYFKIDADTECQCQDFQVAISLHHPLIDAWNDALTLFKCLVIMRPKMLLNQEVATGGTLSEKVFLEISQNS